MYKFLLIFLLSEIPHTLFLSEFPLSIPPPGFSGGTSGKEPAFQCRRQAWRPTPVFLPGESHGHMSLMEGHGESDTTEVTKHSAFSIPQNSSHPPSLRIPSHPAFLRNPSHPLSLRFLSHSTSLRISSLRIPAQSPFLRIPSQPTSLRIPSLKFPHTLLLS